MLSTKSLAIWQLWYQFLLKRSIVSLIVFILRLNKRIISQRRFDWTVTFQLCRIQVSRVLKKRVILVIRRNIMLLESHVCDILKWIMNLTLWLSALFRTLEQRIRCQVTTNHKFDYDGYVNTNILIHSKAIKCRNWQKY